MAKGKASKEGNDIGVDLASNIAKAITRVLSTYDFSPLNKNLAKGIGTIDVSSLIKSSDAGIKQLAVDIKSDLEKGVGDMSITPALDVKPLEKTGDLVRTLINLTEQANKKTAITSDLYKKITDTANQLVASKRMEKDAAEDIAKAYQVKLPPLKLKAAVESVDTKSIEEQVKKIDLIGLQALVTEVDTSLIKDEINKLNPVVLTSTIDLDSKVEIPTPDVNPFLDVANAQQQIVDTTTAQALNYSKINAEQVKQIPQGEEVLKLLKQAKLQHKEIDTLVGVITQGQYKLVEAHKSAEVVLAGVSEQGKTQKALNDTLLQQGIARLSVIKQQGASAEELTAADREQYKALENTLTARELLVSAAQDLVDVEGNRLRSADIVANLLEDELDLVDSIAASYGLSGKAAQYFSEKIKEGVDPADLIKSTELEAVKAMEKSVEVRKKMLNAQGEGVSLDKELQNSYENSNKLLEQTLQHSNLIFFEQVNVAKALEDQKQLRLDLINLAQQEGAAGEGARSLMQAEIGLFNQQVDLLGYQGESAAYVVEQLKKGRDISSIQKDQQLEILETQQKSIDFRKKDLELQGLTSKKIKEIKESHEKIKDRIKQTLDFSKELAKDPKALGMFAAAQVGIGLHKATHAMHELVESGMQAGEAVHVMADGISVMSVLGLSKVSGINKELIAQFGTMNVLTKDQRHTIGEMATKFGLAEKEAVDLTMAISRMPGESAETAAHFKETAIQVGKTKGVMPSAIMKEMAKNAGLMATFSKGGAKGFAEAAASAKKMGIELNSVLSAAEKQLDFENSINAQMEANVLLGKNLNFDKLKEAALAGDANAILQEQTALMQQVGSLDGMNVLQKQKLAEAFGMTTEELVKFNEAQQMEQKYFGENATALDNVIGGVMKYGGAIGGFLAQNGMMILGIGQAVIQLMTLRAMKLSDAGATKLHTASTSSNTLVTNANANAQKLSAAQLKVFKALRAADIPAQQAMTMARGRDTIATTTNTGAVTGNTFATKLSTMATGAWNLVKNIGLGLLRISGVLWIAEKLRTIASATATGIATGAQFAWNAVKGAAITLWNSETVVTLRNALAKKGAAAAEGLYNLAVGAGNMLKKTALGMWLLEKGRILANTIAKWANVGATAAQATANTTLAGTQTAVGTTGAAASGGLASFGAGLASLSAAAGAVPVILALGAAILMIGGGIAIAAIGLAQLVASFKELSGGQIAGALGAVVAVMAGFVGIIYAMVPAIGMLAGVSSAAALPMLAFGAAILMVGAGVAIAALGMSKLVESFKGLSPEQAFAAAVSIGAMAAAFYFLTPALIAVATSATVAAGPLLALGAAVLLAGTGFAIASLGISTIATSLMGLSATSQGLGLVGISLLSIAAGLGAMAFVSTAAMPLIGALVGLAAVAPMLGGLGNLFGGGGEEKQATTQTNTTAAPAKDDKMDILISEIRSLKSIMSKGGVINMDGKKVGDVVRLAMNTSGVR
jgi:hypothetical protein